MNFTSRLSSACTTSLTAAPNPLSRVDNSAGDSTWVSAVNPERSAKPTPHVTLSDGLRVTLSKRRGRVV